MVPRLEQLFSPRGSHRDPRHEHGQALLEFAMVIPLLALIVLGVVKFGALYTNYTQLIDTARSSARQFAIERGQADPCGDTVSRLTAAAGSLTTSDITADITVAGDSNVYTYSNGSVSGSCPTLVAGSAATVQVSYPCDLQIMGVNFLPGCHLRSSATERIE
jgi:Flp pilus assembly protein TadG